MTSTGIGEIQRLRQLLGGRVTDVEGDLASVTASVAAVKRDVAAVARDGLPPGASPSATVTGGPTYLVVRWAAQSNNDPVTYDVHLSTTSGFTPAAATKVAEIDGTMMFIRQTAAGAALAYDTTYYVKLVCRDEDGSAAAGTQGSAQLLRIATVDIGDTVVTDAKIATLIASKSTGQLTNAQIADLAATKVTGQLIAAQLDEALSWATLTNFRHDFSDVSRWESPFGSTGTFVAVSVANSSAGGYVGRSTAYVGRRWPENIPFDADKLYRITARVRQTTDPSSGSKPIYVGISTFKADGVTMAGDNHNYIAAENLSLAVSANWTTVQGFFKGFKADNVALHAAPDPTVPRLLPIDTRYFRPMFLLNWDNSAPGGVADIDYLAVEEIEMPDGYITAAKIKALSITGDRMVARTLTAGEIAVGTLTATEIAAGAVTTEKLTVGSVSNSALVNGGFEDVAAADGTLPANWRRSAVWGATGISRLAAASRSGGWGLKIVPGAAANGDCAPDTVPVNEGEVWFVSFWARKTGTGTTQVYVRPVGGTTFNAIADSNIQAFGIEGVDLPTTWTRYTGQWTIPAAYKWGGVILLNYSANTGGAAEFDDVTFAKVTLAAGIGDGAITTPKLDALAVTAAKIAVGTITADRMVANTITANEIAANAITTDELAANAVIAENILAGEVTAGKLEANLTISNLFRTAGSGRRVEFDSAGLRLYATDGTTIMANLPTAVQDPYFNAHVDAKGIDIVEAVGSNPADINKIRFQRAADGVVGGFVSAYDDDASDYHAIRVTSQGEAVSRGAKVNLEAYSHGLGTASYRSGGIWATGDYTTGKGMVEVFASNGTTGQVSKILLNDLAQSFFMKLRALSDYELQFGDFSFSIGPGAGQIVDYTLPYSWATTHLLFLAAMLPDNTVDARFEGAKPLSLTQGRMQVTQGYGVSTTWRGGWISIGK